MLDFTSNFKLLMAVAATNITFSVAYYHEMIQSWSATIGAAVAALIGIVTLISLLLKLFFDTKRHIKEMDALEHKVKKARNEKLR